jgi:LPXTG-motif cell wall-anchored protein
VFVRSIQKRAKNTRFARRTQSGCFIMSWHDLPHFPHAITLKDTSGKDLDTYVIDPKTGKGVNAANESVDLPKTGNNAPDSLLMMIAAMLLTGLGWLTAKRANRSDKKNNA